MGRYLAIGVFCFFLGVTGILILGAGVAVGVFLPQVMKNYTAQQKVSPADQHSATNSLQVAESPPALSSTGQSLIVDHQVKQIGSANLVPNLLSSTLAVTQTPQILAIQIDGVQVEDRVYENSIKSESKSITVQFAHLDKEVVDGTVKISISGSDINGIGGDVAFENSYGTRTEILTAGSTQVVSGLDLKHNYAYEIEATIGTGATQVSLGQYEFRVLPLQLQTPVLKQVLELPAGDSSPYLVHQPNFATPLIGDKLRMQFDTFPTQEGVQVSFYRMVAGREEEIAGLQGIAVSQPKTPAYVEVPIANLPMGRSQVFVKAELNDVKSPASASFTVINAEKHTGLVTKLSNNKYAEAAAISTPPVSLNHFQGYLKLQGASHPSAAIQILLYSSTVQADSYNYVNYQATGQADSAGNWEKELKLPPTFQGKLIAIANSTQGYQVSTPIDLVPGAIDIANPPELIVKKEDASTISEFPHNSNAAEFKVEIESVPGADHVAVVRSHLVTGPLAFLKTDSLSKDIPLPEGKHRITVELVQGESVGPKSPPKEMYIKSTGPKVTRIAPTNLAASVEKKTITVYFNSENPLNVEKSAIDTVASTIFTLSGSSTPTPAIVQSVDFIKAENALRLNFNQVISPDVYTLRINRHASLVDIYGNELAESFYEFSVILLVGDESAFNVAGLPATTGPLVEYAEYTDPRDYINGFNPSDKVVTRIARLYYFRDAHRVVQIINREAQSYNLHSASMTRQLADQARLFAESQIDQRKSAERKAVRAAQQARQAEATLQATQQELIAARQDQTRVGNALAGQNQVITTLQNSLADANSQSPVNSEQVLGIERELQEQQDVLARLESDQNRVISKIATAEQRVTQASASVQALREEEIDETEEAEEAQLREDRAVERQFRLEVVAAEADPDTFAPGDPNSNDPVVQVSVSVIGEGIIQLRGPLKGVNIVRTMINQIDSPVGQVRVGVHTVQVNGEDGENMEEVVGRIGRYIDHSRFLTSQSAQMLRNAVVLVASRKAQEYYSEDLLCPADVRDARYQEAFFGADFLNELREMDSEFLQTGNKLLSLHSMDSTSLASALFLLGLASNDTRLEILQTFQMMLQEKLPIDEFEYFDASDLKKNYRFKKFKFLADNARFVSFRGYFDNQVVGGGTLNPVQREFIRLAQILKSRLITEVELKQRVMERALIEERIGDHEKYLRLTAQHEAEAQKILKNQNVQIQNEITKTATLMQEFQGELESLSESINETSEKRAEILGNLVGNLFENAIQPSGLSSILVPYSEIKNLLPAEYKANQTSIQDSLLSLDIDNLIKALQEGFQLRIEATKQNLRRSVLNSSTLEVRIRELDSLNRSIGDVAFEIDLPLIGNNRETFNISYDPTDSEKWSSDSSPGKINAIKTTFRNTNQQLKSNYKSLNVGAYKGLGDSIESLSKDTETLLREAEIQVDAISKEALEAEGTKDDAAIKSLLEIYSLHYQINSATWKIAEAIQDKVSDLQKRGKEMQALLLQTPPGIKDAHVAWISLREEFYKVYVDDNDSSSWKKLAPIIVSIDSSFVSLLKFQFQYQFAQDAAEKARRPLDHKKFLDLLIDETEEKFIELVEGTRAHTAVMDDYVKRLATALEDDFNTQFYEPAFRHVREQTYSCWDTDFAQIEHTTVLTNNRMLGKVLPQATMEFDLPKRGTLLNESLRLAGAAYEDYGALLADPNFLALTKMYSGQPTSSVFDNNGPAPLVRDVLPGLSSQVDESLLIQQPTGQPEFASQLEGLIPDPAIYKFETGTGYEIRPVIQPDGQSVVFKFNYMYTTNVREPVRVDEKHLGRVKRHFINTDVQIGNYELREVSRYRVALKARRTSRGIPLLEDIPGIGIIGRPLPQGESSLQQNIILAHTVIYPTMFDLMGLRWAPAVADLDSQRLLEQEFVFRKRMQLLKDEVYDYSSSQVDEFLRIPQGERRADLYRMQEPIPLTHPNGYKGPGLNRQDSELQEGFDPTTFGPDSNGLNTAPLIPYDAPKLPAPIHSELIPNDKLNPYRPEGNSLPILELNSPPIMQPLPSLIEGHQSSNDRGSKQETGIVTLADSQIESTATWKSKRLPNLFFQRENSGNEKLTFHKPILSKETSGKDDPSQDSESSSRFTIKLINFTE